MTAQQHTHLHDHLFKADGKESVAVLLCGKRSGDYQHRLFVRDIHLLPDEECSYRSENEVVWHTETIVPLLEKAHAEERTIVKIHSHPNGLCCFSKLDDVSDLKLLPALQAWTESDAYHCSVVMLPDGSMFGRYINDIEQLVPLSKIWVIGDELRFWFADSTILIPEFASSHTQAFGEGTFQLLSHLSIAVVGCSGTGSPVIEQLARLGVGRLVLVDGDVIEERNLNRIINSFRADVDSKEPKVNVQTRAINAMNIGTDVEKVPYSLWDKGVVELVAECDVLFGCMDTIDGRYLLNAIATYYSIPYFDLGVTIRPSLEEETYGQIDIICGSVHYLQPGYSLLQRGVITMEKVKEAGLRRNDPKAYEQQVRDGYIKGIDVHRPAVISLNMLIAAYGVLELLARLHPYRDDPNGEYDHVEVSLESMTVFTKHDGVKCSIFGSKIGLGDRVPLLDNPELS